MSYFYYTARPRYLNPIRQLRFRNERRSLMCLSSDHPALFSMLKRVIAASQSTGCEFSDYFELYKKTRELRPQYVLELGSGISSLVISFALQENFKDSGVQGKLVSLEEHPSFHAQIVELFPDDLREYAELVLSPRGQKKYGRFWGAYYENVPRYEYELVFVDGPSLKSGRDSPPCFNADFINVLLASPAERRIDAIVDQRIDTYRTFRQLIPKARIHYNPIKKLSFVRGASRSCLAPFLLDSPSTL